MPVLPSTKAGKLDFCWNFSHGRPGMKARLNPLATNLASTSMSLSQQPGNLSEKKFACLRIPFRCFNSLDLERDSISEPQYQIIHVEKGNPVTVRCLILQGNRSLLWAEASLHGRGKTFSSAQSSPPANIQCLRKTLTQKKLLAMLSEPMGVTCTH